MDLLLAVLFILYVVLVPGKPVDGRIVSLEGEEKIALAVKNYNCTNPETEVFIARSVGTHGRYKNTGFDYELQHREDKTPNEYEYSKGLRRFDGVGYSFIYMESEATKAFINYLEALNSSIDPARVLPSGWHLVACNIGGPGG